MVDIDNGRGGCHTELARGGAALIGAFVALRPEILRRALAAAQVDLKRVANHWLGNDSPTVWFAEAAVARKEVSPRRVLESASRAHASKVCIRVLRVGKCTEMAPVVLRVASKFWGGKGGGGGRGRGGYLLCAITYTCEWLCEYDDITPHLLVSQPGPPQSSWQ